MYTHLIAPVSRAEFDKIMGQQPQRGGERYVKGIGKQRWAEYHDGEGEVIAHWMASQDNKMVGYGLIK